MPSFFNHSKKQNSLLSIWMAMYAISAASAEGSPGQPSSPMLFSPQNQTAPTNMPPSQPQARRDDSISTIFILAAPAVMTLALILYLVIRSKRTAVVLPVPDLELQVKGDEASSNKDEQIASSSAPSAGSRLG